MAGRSWLSPVVGALQPRIGHRNHADVHGAAVSRKHGRLDLNPPAVRAERRVRVIRRRVPVSGREQHHFARPAIDQPEAARKIVADRPTPIRRAVDVRLTALIVGCTIRGNRGRDREAREDRRISVRTGNPLAPYG
jgi:hypothetical protein